MIDDQGRTVSSGTGAAVGPNTLVASKTSAAVASASASATQAANNGIGNFGKCTVPQIEFAAGFDNRKETSFQPVDRSMLHQG